MEVIREKINQPPLTAVWPKWDEHRSLYTQPHGPISSKSRLRGQRNDQRHQPISSQHGLTSGHMVRQGLNLDDLWPLDKVGWGYHSDEGETEGRSDQERNGERRGIYYPPEVMTGEYCGLGVFLLQYSPLVNIAKNAFMIA